MSVNICEKSLNKMWIFQFLPYMHWLLTFTDKDNLTQQEMASITVQKVTRPLRGREAGHLLAQSLSGVVTD